VERATCFLDPCGNDLSSIFKTIVPHIQWIFLEKQSIDYSHRKALRISPTSLLGGWLAFQNGYWGSTLVWFMARPDMLIGVYDDLSFLQFCRQALSWVGYLAVTAGLAICGGALVWIATRLYRHLKELRPIRGSFEDWRHYVWRVDFPTSFI